jgi:hypothetical protein
MSDRNEIDGYVFGAVQTRFRVGISRHGGEKRNTKRLSPYGGVANNRAKSDRSAKWPTGTSNS